MEFKKKVLDNGLTIIGEVNEAALSAAVGFFCKTGSRDETPEISGVSHFLEHMMFKGTEKMSALEVNEAFDHLGAKFNAFTSEENTVYYAAVLPEYLQECSSLWAQLMRPSLRDEDFDIDRLGFENLDHRSWVGQYRIQLMTRRLQGVYGFKQGSGRTNRPLLR